MSDSPALFVFSGVPAAPAAQPTLSNRPSSRSPRSTITADGQYCSGCRRNRPLKDFSWRKDNGLRRKTCIRHETKPELPVIPLDSMCCQDCKSARLFSGLAVDSREFREIRCDHHAKQPPREAVHNLSDWNEFCDSMRQWRTKDKLELHEFEGTFSFDSVPALDESRSDDNSLFRWFHGLVDLIQELGGYKFSRPIVCVPRTGIYACDFYCCQDEGLNRTRKIRGRGKDPMREYSCQSLLRFEASRENRTLDVTVHHRHHATYKSKSPVPPDSGERPWPTEAESRQLSAKLKELIAMADELCEKGNPLLLHWIGDDLKESLRFMDEVKGNKKRRTAPPTTESTSESTSNYQYDPLTLLYWPPPAK